MLSEHNSDTLQWTLSMHCIQTLTDPEGLWMAENPMEYSRYTLKATSRVRLLPRLNSDSGRHQLWNLRWLLNLPGPQSPRCSVEFNNINLIDYVHSPFRMCKAWCKSKWVLIMMVSTVKVHPYQCALKIYLAVVPCLSPAYVEEVSIQFPFLCSR
jgi:hypothetical protein